MKRDMFRVLILALAPKNAGETVPDNLGTGNMASLEKKLEASLELGELVTIRDEIAERALARGVTPEGVRAAGLDAAKGNELLGLSEAEAAALWARIDAAIGSLYANYPELSGPLDGGQPSCGACDAGDFAELWARYLSVVSAGGAGAPVGPEGSPARPPMKCKWAQFTAGIAFCAVRSGGSLLLYAICAYGVFCGSCDGGIADILCP
jgi:hypothetical protein